MAPLKISSFALSLVLSPFLAFPAWAEGIAQTSGGAPQPGSNTVFTNPPAIATPSTSTAITVTPGVSTGVSVQAPTTPGAPPTVTVPPQVSQSLGNAVGLILAVLNSPNVTPVQTALLNNLSTNLGVSAVLSTSQTAVSDIVVNVNQGGATTTSNPTNFGQVLATVSTALSVPFTGNSSISIQVGNRTVTLSPL